jgi:hypothetical protein
MYLEDGANCIVKSFVGREARIIIKLFKNTNIKTAYKTTFTINDNLCRKPEEFQKADPHKYGLIYQ